MSLYPRSISITDSNRAGNGGGTAYLQRIFPREALLAVIAREGLDGQMNPFMTLQVVISIEALWALITFERAVVQGRGLPVSLMMRSMTTIHMLHARQMAAIECGEEAGLHVAHERHLPARIVHIGHDGPGHGGQRVRRPRRTRIAQMRRLHGRRLAGSGGHPRGVDAQAALRAPIRRAIRAGRRGVWRGAVHGSGMGRVSIRVRGAHVVRRRRRGRGQALRVDHRMGHGVLLGMRRVL
jgi:hypothetical protein